MLPLLLMLVLLPPLIATAKTVTSLATADTIIYLATATDVTSLVVLDLLLVYTSLAIVTSLAGVSLCMASVVCQC